MDAKRFHRVVNVVLLAILAARIIARYDYLEPADCVTAPLGLTENVILPAAEQLIP
jgi:hypothetical protein